jgi:hypothetical protein
MSRALAVVVVAVVVLAGCSDNDDPPGLDRIDGPARVDPSFDPFEPTPPTTTPGG